MAIPFLDLPAQHVHFQDEFLEKVKELLGEGRFIGGKHVQDFEEAFSEFLGCDYSIGVNSGTDALLFALKILGIGANPEDEVICPAFGFIATVDAVIRAGARPVLVDVDPHTYTISPERAQEALSPHTKAIIPVHLFGRASNMAALREIVEDRGIEIIEDCAQACGAEADEEFLGTIGRFGCFSFYPTKNLGGIGDGGMLTTNDEALAREARMLRDHGRSELTGAFEKIGFNSRLDAVHAIYLDMKIEDLEEANVDRVETARLYDKRFEDTEVGAPEFLDDNSHVYCLYTIQVRDRDRLQNFLKEKEIGSMIYYPRGLHREPALDGRIAVRGPLSVTDHLCNRVISLPCYPGMKKNHVEEVASTVLEFLERNEERGGRRR